MLELDREINRFNKVTVVFWFFKLLKNSNFKTIAIHDSVSAFVLGYNVNKLLKLSAYAMMASRGMVNMSAGS